jgi:hypothetical protein
VIGQVLHDDHEVLSDRSVGAIVECCGVGLGVIALGVLHIQGFVPISQVNLGKINPISS